MVSIDKAKHYLTRATQELAYRTGWRVGKPTQAIAIMTYRCNSQCVHCKSYEVPRMNELNTEEWKDGLGHLRKWLGPVFLSITGGEALLRKDTIDIVRHAADLGFWVEFLTNGWVVSEEIASDLVSTGVKRLNVSLDGSKEIHDQIRGIKGFYERSTHALELMAAQMHKSKQDIQIYAKTTIMNYNVDELGDIVRFAKKIGIYGVLFQAIGPVYYSDQQGNPNWYKNNPLWVDDGNRVTCAIGELKTLKDEGFPIINSHENLSMIEDYFLDPERHAHEVNSHQYGRKKPECHSWASGLQIDPDGGMKMCHWMKPFGNLKDGELKKTWRSRSSCPRCGHPR